MMMAACVPAASTGRAVAGPSSAAAATPAGAVISSPNGWLVHVSARRGAAVTRSPGGKAPPSIPMLPATRDDHHTCPPTGDPQDRPAAWGAPGGGRPAALARVGVGPSVPCRTCGAAGWWLWGGCRDHGGAACAGVCWLAAAVAGRGRADAGGAGGGGGPEPAVG